MTDLLAHFTKQADAMLDTLKQMAAFESPTTGKAAVDRLGKWLRERLNEAGAEVEIHVRETHGDITLARWNADSDGRPILILGHIDTVWDEGTLDKMPLREEDGKLYGPGVYDMKGGITLALQAIIELQKLKQLPDRPIRMLLTTDEETGSNVSRDLIQDTARDCMLVLVMEPALPDGSVKTGRKSTGTFYLTARGVSSHAGGAHEEGVNAIVEIAHQIAKVSAWTDYAIGTTTSAGLIQGGTRSNVIPDECRAVVDSRVMTVAEQERVTQAFHSLEPVLPGATLEVSGGFDRPPMERNEQMLATFEQAKAIAADIGLSIHEGQTGGGSDGNFTAGMGIATLDGMGPVGAGAHALHEHVVIEDLARRAALVAAILKGWDA